MPKVFFTCFISWLTLSGCSTFCSTSQPYVPAFEEDKNVNAEVNIGGSGINVSAAYSPFRNFYAGASGNVFSAGADYHYAGGPLIGYTQRGDSLENFRTDIQLGCTIGSSRVGDLQDTSMVSGLDDFFSIHGHAFIGAEFGSARPFFLGAGISFSNVNLHYRLMHYPAAVEGPFANHAGIGSIFVVYQKPMGTNNRAFFVMHAGYQRALPGIRNSIYIIPPVILRVGFNFRLGTK